jgi:chromosome segregation ATPase
MTINRHTMGEAKLLYADSKEIVPAHEYEALAAELADAKQQIEDLFAIDGRSKGRIRDLEAAMDAKNVKIGRLDDDVMRLTKAVEFREARIKELAAELAGVRSDLAMCEAKGSSLGMRERVKALEAVIKAVLAGETEFWPDALRKALAFTPETGEKS